MRGAAGPRWLSFHIFHGGDLDRLLLDGVRPALDEWTASGAIDGFFFVRFWNGGPHLRLRLAAPGETADETGRSARATLQAWVTANPGPAPSPDAYVARLAEMEPVHARLRETAGPGDLPALGIEPFEPLQPPDRVQERPWTFETLRYGGAGARAGVLEHFQASSALALRIVAGTRDRWPARQTLALYLTAGAASALGPAAPATARVYGLASRWSDLVAGTTTRHGAPPADFPPYEAERHALAELRALLERGLPLPEQSPEVNALLQAWELELKRLLAGLRSLSREGRLTAEPAHILMDCVHMMNNRLGIPLDLECWFDHLVAGAVDDVRGATPRGATRAWSDNGG